MKKAILILSCVLLILPVTLIIWNVISYSLNSFERKIDNISYISNDDANGSINSSDISYFFGDTIFNYANYIEKNNKIEFNGSLDDILKTESSYKKIKLWKNDFSSEQLIICKPYDIVVQDLRVDVLNDNYYDSPEVSVKKMNFIKSKKTNGTDYIKEGISYYPDELTKPYIDNMNSFPVQPFMIQVSTKNFQGSSGNYDYRIRIQYQVDGIYRTKIIPISIEVDSRTLFTNQNDKNENNRFSYDGMISPTNFYKYGIQQFKNSNYELKSSKPDFFPEVIKNNDYYFDWMKFNSFYQPAFLNDNYINIVKKNYEVLNYMNLQYGYTSTFGNSFIRIYATNNSTYSDENEYWDDIAKPMSEVLQNKNITWSFDFSGFDAYVKFLTDLEIPKIYVPIIPRGNDVIKYYYFFENYGIDTDEFAPVTALKDQIISPDGTLTKDGEVYKKTLFRYLISALSEHVYSMKDDPTYKLSNGDSIEVYYSFDETRYSIDSNFRDEVEGTDKIVASDSHSILKSHAYIGWEYDDEFANNDKKKIGSLIEGNFDDITLQQREFIEDYFQTDKSKYLTAAIEFRKNNNQVTKFYSSWNNFPAPYIASNPADAAWGPLVAYKLGLNGFTRYAFEGYRNNVSLINEDNTASHEPGDAYLLYPGTGEGSNWSVRIENALESYNMVLKLQQIYPNGWDNPTNSSGDVYDTNFIDEISKTKDPTRSTEYQWNLNYYNDHAITFNSNENVSLQIEKIKNYILQH